jgi:hypothetical protein
VKRRDQDVEPRPITVRAERAASLLGVSPRMLQQLARDGVVPSVLLAGRCRLYRVADLEKWAAALPETLPIGSPPRDAGRPDVGGGAT